MNNKDIEKQLTKLREEWKKASRSERKIIEVRGKLLKKSLGKKDIVETAKEIFEIKEG